MRQGCDWQFIFITPSGASGVFISWAQKVRQRHWHRSNISLFSCHKNTEIVGSVFLTYECSLKSHDIRRGLPISLRPAKIRQYIGLVSGLTRIQQTCESLSIPPRVFTALSGFSIRPGYSIFIKVWISPTLIFTFWPDAILAENKWDYGLQYHDNNLQIVRLSSNMT